jgi:hypothetical protein
MAAANALPGRAANSITSKTSIHAYLFFIGPSLPGIFSSSILTQ